MTDEPLIIERLARIETKLDNAIGRADDHETRIRRLERALWLVTGAAAAVGGALGSIVQQVLGGA
ncbi:MAG TPA: hypothetical protein VFV66_28550 [Nonomuraea sp.]|nr:hypothetical protein [Nonomuraea sp.]